MVRPTRNQSRIGPLWTDPCPGARGRGRRCGTSRLAIAQAEGVSNHHKVRQAHRKRAYHWAEEPKHRQGYRRGVVEKCPEEILVNCPQGGLRQRESLRNPLQSGTNENDVG